MGFTLFINYCVLRRFNINRIATPATHMILIIAIIFVSADVGTIILRTLVNVAAVLSVTLPEALLLETLTLQYQISHQSSISFFIKFNHKLTRKKKTNFI